MLIKKNQLRKTIIKGMGFFLVFSLLVPVMAQETENLMQLSLEEILNMEVTTVSKFAEKLFNAPGVITVVTKDELDRFGGVRARSEEEHQEGAVAAAVCHGTLSTITPVMSNCKHED